MLRIGGVQNFEIGNIYIRITCIALIPLAHLVACAERPNGKGMNNLRTKTKECLFHASIFQKQCYIVHLNTCRVKSISIGNYTCMCNWFGSKITHTHSIRPTHRQNVCQWSLDRKLETQSFSRNHCLFEIKNSVL